MAVQQAVSVAWLGRTSSEDAQDPTLSLPRQLRRSQAMLPEHWVIVAHYYDVESGRKDLEARGRAHPSADVPIRRDGGLQDLLAAAARPDRPFTVVICESIERVARRTYVGTHIEHELERCGVALYAADEPLPTSFPARRATPILTRRVKQAVAEWYVLQLLELSWDGTVEHTLQGWNIGKPPYGYRAETVPHPVAAKRAEGRTKHRLAPHPAQAPVVARIFELRARARLGYRRIADRLNQDLDSNPPPQPTRPGKGLGEWSAGAVRDILHNPKYTGYMVYNRRATKNGNRPNPPAAWIWSPEPVHPPLVTRARFEAAAAVTRALRTPLTKLDTTPTAGTQQTYLLRSYLRCTLCGRRIWGKTQDDSRVYYLCRKDPRHVTRPWFAAHPATVRVRAEAIEPLVLDFLTTHQTQATATSGARSIDTAAARHPAPTGTDKQLAILHARQARLLDELELLDPVIHRSQEIETLRRGIHLRYIALTTDIKQLAILHERAIQQGRHLPRPEPGSKPRSMRPSPPADAQRAEFAACGLDARFDVQTQTVTLTANIDGTPVSATYPLPTHHTSPPLRHS